MAPLVLEGETLGQKHQHFNKLVKAAVADQAWTLDSISHSDPDADNLLRIDVAATRRDVPYILEVLKSTDLLYVTRAIKRSTWLITEAQYEHIINPDYLEREMFPFMTAKAKTKLLFAIRLTLKDEKRVEAFFKYYENDPPTAMKWLQGCSVATIAKTVKNNSQYFNCNQILRLCRKSFTILKAYCEQDYAHYKKEMLQQNTAFLTDHCNEYLDIIDSLVGYYEKPTFKKNATQVILDKCRERVIDNFEKFCRTLHTPTFAQNLKPEQVQDFLIKQKKNKDMKPWLKYDNIRHFLKYIPKDTRIEFVKSLFVGKEDTDTDDLQRDDEFSTQYRLESSIMACAMKCATRRSAPSTSNAHIYRWYRYAPFHTAMTELKKLIYVEPLPAERNAILTVLVKNARSNQQHMQTLLEYYRNKHLNEPLNFKIQFVNSVISYGKTHDFDENTWNILNNIFQSLEVYMESENKVPFCINAIIVYKVLNDQDIPEIIEKKFSFSTLKDYRKKLNENQQDKLFNYLYAHLMKTFKNQEITNEIEFGEFRDTLEKMLGLLNDWNKQLKHYPVVISKIKDLIKIKRQNDWETYFSSLYDAAKPWRKDLFEESLIIHPSDEACLNALKHDPGLLSRYQSEIEAMSFDDTISMERVLRKIRIYWSDTIAQQWTDLYLQKVEQPKGRKTIKYLCILMPCRTILPLIQENAPAETKIDWTNADDAKLNVRKNIAKNMHLVRPTVGLDTVLLYAKGDYLYHAMPSVNAILYNMSSDVTSHNITKLLDAPVSLQKHGICSIFRKLKYDDIKEIVNNLWNKTKNSSIRTILFKQTFKLLCNEKNDKTVNDLWQLFKMYIDSLSSEENAVIYHTFTKFKNVPISVRPQFFMKGYLYLKSVTAKPNCDKIIDELFSNATELVELLEPDFVENILLDNLEQKIISKKDCDLRNHFDILTIYIMSGKSEESQVSRYEKLMLPLLKKAFASWKLRHNGEYYIKININLLLNALIMTLSKVITTKQNIVPIKLFKVIQAELRNALPTEENYEMLMNWDVATLYVEAVETFTKANPQIYEKEQSDNDAIQISVPYGYSSDDNKLWEKICSEVATPFGEACVGYLKQDILFNKYPALFFCVKDVLRQLCSNLNFNCEANMKFLKAMLIDKNASTIYCIVIKFMGELYNSDEVKAIKKEAFKLLRSSTSTEVKIYLSSFENNDPDLELTDEEEQNKTEE